MSLPKQAYEAAAAWANADADSADRSTGIEALGKLVAALAEQDSAFYAIVATAGKLLVLYAEQGTDPDGETTLVLVDQLHRANLL